MSLMPRSYHSFDERRCASSSGFDAPQPIAMNCGGAPAEPGRCVPASLAEDGDRRVVGQHLKHAPEPPTAGVAPGAAGVLADAQFADTHVMHDSVQPEQCECQVAIGTKLADTGGLANESKLPN